MSGNRMPVLYPFGPYVRTHRRHVLQQSQYTLCAPALTMMDGFEKYDTIFETGRHQQGMCWKFTIPVTERPKVLKLLYDYNLSAFSLFDSQDSLMDTLAVREFLFEK